MTRGEAVIRKHADAVLWIAIRDMLEHHEAHVELAVKRHNGAGAVEYGDVIYTKPPEECRRERFEEHADIYGWGAFELENATTG